MWNSCEISESKFNHIMFKIFKEQNIKRFEKILAWDNLSSPVLYSKYVLVIIFALMIGRYIRYVFSLINTLPCLIESAIILTLMIGAKYILKTVNGNSKQIVIHARIFTTIFFFFNLFAFNVLRHSCKDDKCQRNDVCYSADNKRYV